MKATIDRIMGRVREVIEEELEDLRASLKDELIGILRGDAPLPKRAKPGKRPTKHARATMMKPGSGGKTGELAAALAEGPVTRKQIEAMGLNPTSAICNLRSREGLKIKLDRETGAYSLER